MSKNKKKSSIQQAPEESTSLDKGSSRGRVFVSWIWKSIPFLALLAAYIVMVVFESDYLKRVEELNLFLYTPLYFKQQLVVAGGLLTWLGTYFTQFFYHPWLGSLVLCAWMGLLMWLMKQTFAISRLWMPILIVPVAMILLIDFDLGYWLYYLKLRGHFFIPVIGASMAVATTWLFRVMAARVKSNLSFVLLLVFFVAIAVVAYPIGGHYGIFTIALIVFITWRINQLSRTQKSILSFIGIMLIIFIPRICYQHIYYQANSDFILWQGLPLYDGGETFTAYYIPYVVLFATLLFMSITYKIDIDFRQWIPRPWMAIILPALIIAVAVWSCWQWWYKDVTFHEEIRMNSCVDKSDWEGVLKIARQHDGEPTRMMVVFKNLALFKLGRAGNEMYAYPDGAKAPKADFEVRMVQMGGKNLYLHYGLPNYCYRWCLEDGVEFGWRADYLKYLVRCSLLNGEWKVAQKYIDLLKQTKYYREWAEHYEQLATSNVAKAVAEDPELGPIRRLMFDGDDRLGSDQSLIELFMLNIQAYRVTDDPVCAELVLLAALQLKDIATFWRAFNQYALLKKDGFIPRYFQEAAFLYGNLEQKVDISRMPFDPSIPASYQAFMQAAQQYAGKSEEQLKELLRVRFGDTFYYNYFLMRNMKTY